MKPEVYRVAERYGLKVFVVANAFMNVPRSPMIERVIVPEGPDVADDWIAERAGASDIVVTADIPLAARCVSQRRDRHRPDRQAFQRGFDRHGAGDAQPDVGLAVRRRGDARAASRSAGRICRVFCRRSIWR